MDFKQWDGFKKGDWTSDIDVRGFIQANYTPYDGRISFFSAIKASTPYKATRL